MIHTIDIIEYIIKKLCVVRHEEYHMISLHYIISHCKVGHELLVYIIILLHPCY